MRISSDDFNAPQKQALLFAKILFWKLPPAPNEKIVK